MYIYIYLYTSLFISPFVVPYPRLLPPTSTSGECSVRGHLPGLQAEADGRRGALPVLFFRACPAVVSLLEVLAYDLRGQSVAHPPKHVPAMAVPFACGLFLLELLPWWRGRASSDACERSCGSWKGRPLAVTHHPSCSSDRAINTPSAS